MGPDSGALSGQDSESLSSRRRRFASVGCARPAPRRPRAECEATSSSELGDGGGDARRPRFRDGMLTTWALFHALRATHTPATPGKHYERAQTAHVRPQSPHVTTLTIRALGSTPFLPTPHTNTTSTRACSHHPASYACDPSQSATRRAEMAHTNHAFLYTPTSATSCIADGLTLPSHSLSP